MSKYAHVYIKSEDPAIDVQLASTFAVAAQPSPQPGEVWFGLHDADVWRKAVPPEREYGDLGAFTHRLIIRGKDPDKQDRIARRLFDDLASTTAWRLVLLLDDGDRVAATREALAA